MLTMYPQAHSDAYGSPPAPSEVLPTPDATPPQVETARLPFASVRHCVLYPHFLRSILKLALYQPELIPRTINSSSSVPQSVSNSTQASARLSHSPPPSPRHAVPHKQSNQEITDIGRRSLYHSENSLDTMGNPHLPQSPPSGSSCPLPVPVQPDTARVHQSDADYRKPVDLSDRPLPSPSYGTSSATERNSESLADRPPTPPSKPSGTRSQNQITNPPKGSSSLQHASSMHQQGPVRGKPLIFAAMAATSEVEDMEPQLVGMMGSTAAHTKIMEYNLYASGEKQTATPPPEPNLEASQPSTPPRRKLSKTPKRSSRKEVPSPEKQDKLHSTMAQSTSPVDRSSPSRHHSHREVVPADRRSHSREAVSRHNSGNADSSSRRRSTAQDGKLHKRSRDGAKTLTDRQMDKLNNRLSYSGASTSKEHTVQQSRRSMAEEQPSTRSVLHHQPSYRASQAMAGPVPAAMPDNVSAPPSPSKPSAHHSYHAVPARTPPTQLPRAQWPEQTHQPSTSIQPLTPPDDYVPVLRHSRETSMTKTKRISPNNVEELEVFAGHEPCSELIRPHSEAPSEPSFYPLLAHLSDPVLLENLLAYFSYYEWLTLSATSKETRRVLYEDGREQVLSRYLHTVGYSKWIWKDPEPLMLTVEVSISLVHALHELDSASGPLPLYARCICPYASLRSHCYELGQAQLVSRPTNYTGADVLVSCLHSGRATSPRPSGGRGGTQCADGRYGTAIARVDGRPPPANAVLGVAAVPVQVVVANEPQYVPGSKPSTVPIASGKRRYTGSARSPLSFPAIPPAPCAVAPGIRAIARG
jgi:hypothetical protein